MSRTPRIALISFVVVALAFAAGCRGRRGAYAPGASEPAGGGTVAFVATPEGGAPAGGAPAAAAPGDENSKMASDQAVRDAVQRDQERFLANQKLQQARELTR